jgi:hypothetical protein
MVLNFKYMQEKESKSSRHFTLSLIKSVIRIFAGIALLYADQWYINAAGGMLIGAEVLGILEEL